MTYPVRCECGTTHQVSGGSAGSRFDCKCGRAVVVPSLSELRREAGEFSASPELIIDSMLRNNELPDTTDCLECHAHTDHLLRYRVVCEQVEIKEAGAKGCSAIAMLLVMGWAGMLIAAMMGQREGLERGRHVAFTLPLRLCHACAAKIKSAKVRELFERVPVYSYLLTKYPHATITPR